MMTFEQALEAWVRRRDPKLFEEKEVTKIEVEHSEGYQSDMTYWPAETTVKVKTRFLGKTGQKHYRSYEYSAGEDPLGFAQELFELVREIEESNAEPEGLDLGEPDEPGVRYHR